MVAMIKSLLRRVITFLLGRQVKKLIKRFDIQVVGVVGSIGKTSTKMAIARVLDAGGKRVRYQAGNYNTELTVPLVFFDEPIPSLFNPLAWAGVLWRNQKQLREYFADVVVVELGIDHPGEMKRFAKYLQLDLAVVTALTPEHMENFEGESQAAQENLVVQQFAKRLIINTDLVAAAELNGLSVPHETYGTSDKADYGINKIKLGPEGHFDIGDVRFDMEMVAKAQSYSATAAIIIAGHLGLDEQDVRSAVSGLKAFEGRLRLLRGKNNSVIIDDTYNSSIAAALAALEALNDYPKRRKIALLGNMNEMGAFSEKYHTQLGEACDRKKIELVVTLGEDANKFTAAAAEKNGCKVKRAKNAQEAGEIIRESLTDATVVLAKGSQNGVYAEEAVKLLLADPADARHLVRQGDEWATKKASSA